jgi:TetR/AcrR family transcriptional regulator, transcriptional repressor for nem operon
MARMVDVATPLPDTANRMLDVAERLVQQRGFNSFSYADIAAELGVTKATLHYHFASKAALGSAVIDRYALRFFDALAAIDARGGTAEERLAGFVEVYANVLRDQRMCLCGMLAADQLTLPDSMKVPVLEFFDRTVAWVASVLERGVADGSLAPIGSVTEAAKTLVWSIEGAMLVARAYDDVPSFERAATQLIGALVRR